MKVLLFVIVGLSAGGNIGLFAQDNGGRSFSFETDDQVRQENWRPNGTSAGFFGWTDVNGDGIDIEFIADEFGYRVIKKKNRLGGRGRNPRDKDDAVEFEFDVEEGLADTYSFKYDTGTSFREEAKRGGVVFGKYGYLTADGQLHVVRYTASRKRGYVPIREIKQAADYSAVAAEPISPVPLRRMRELATPPKLWPIEVVAVTENVLIDANVASGLSTAAAETSTITDLPFSSTETTSHHGFRLNPNTFAPVITSQLSKHSANVKSTNQVNSRGLRAQNGGLQQFSYNVGRHFHKQNRVDNSSVSGQFGWKDAAGVFRIVHYVADNAGFKVFRNRTFMQP